MHISQPIVAALELVRQFLVIEAEQVENRGVEIVDVNFLFRSGESELIGCAVNMAAFYSPARHPH